MDFNRLSVNKYSECIIDDLIINNEKYSIIVEKDKSGAWIVDCGMKCPGSIEAGLKVSELCMGGLGNVSLNYSSFSEKIIWNISVFSSHPVVACLASQYAGWNLKHGNFFSLGSGPARALAQREDIFKKLNYTDQGKKTAIVLEVNAQPPEEIIKKIFNDCKVDPGSLYIFLTPTTSIVGNIQVCSRVLEVGLHKAHEIGFPINKIIHGYASTPLPPLSNDTLNGMGRTNDSIIYGGIVDLTVEMSDAEILENVKKIPSQSAKDYGEPFKNILKKYNGDFYKIDPSLFSPSQVKISSMITGNSFFSGNINKELVQKSFFDD